MKGIMLVADYANLTGDGRINVLGIFNQIKATTFPARHASMWLVAKVSLEVGERVTTRPCQIRLMGEDGISIVDIEGELPFKQVEIGLPPEVNVVLPLHGVVFPQPGIYEFALIVNDETKATVPIQVVQIEQPNSE